MVFKMLKKKDKALDKYFIKPQDLGYNMEFSGEIFPQENKATKVENENITRPNLMIYPGE
ncbi:hypothetical protein [Thermovenabulum sp.]|uniref:hypothetical protein n=1 Tax=Thermovenabulum sp. TaxID=3100335 RepID=UPI003C79E0D2